MPLSRKGARPSGGVGWPAAPARGCRWRGMGGILELNYDLDACDLILALLNDIQRTVWIHAYAGPNGQETYNVGFIQGGAALRP